jgi:hypothetical protein
LEVVCAVGLDVVCAVELEVGLAVELEVGLVPELDVDFEVVFGVVCPMTCNTAIKQTTTVAIAIRFIAGFPPGLLDSNVSAEESAWRLLLLRKVRGDSNRAACNGKYHPPRPTIVLIGSKAILLKYQARMSKAGRG